ncbi:MAG: hypothetical protein QG597_2985 [Actinomycetota bacterium]|nr:hypothetical protein [Actinomycetota bacterium]
MTTRDDSGRAALAAGTQPMAKAATARERARAEITAELLNAARDQLAEVGAGSLSLRAIAREVGMASSAIYRYFPSRDDLLTRLIIEAYDDVGLVAESAQVTTSDQPPAEQFRAVWHAVRRWAVAHPHQYALIFGSPVPGYSAPTDTIAPATRLPEVLLRILAEAAPPGNGDPESIGPRLSTPVLAGVSQALAPIRATLPMVMGDALLLAAITSWTALLGAISFEIFGHTYNVVDEAPGPREDFFGAQIQLMTHLLGLP